MKFWKLAAAKTVLFPTSANAALIERLGAVAYYDDQENCTSNRLIIDKGRLYEF